MSNKLYIPKEEKKSQTLALFWAWVCLMSMVFMFFFIPSARYVSTLNNSVATPSNATSSSAIEDRSLATGFFTLDGKGIASRPFMTESELNVIYLNGEPTTFTALPIMLSGYMSDDSTVLNVEDWGLYPYEMGTTGAADAYYTCIQSGWQEGFEDLWSEVYDVLNNDDGVEHGAIDASLLQEILSEVYGKEEYGDLRDIVTDCLVLIKDINTNGPSEEYNQQALNYYNRFYSWLCNFSVEFLKSE